MRPLSKWYRLNPRNNFWRSLSSQMSPQCCRSAEDHNIYFKNCLYFSQIFPLWTLIILFDSYLQIFSYPFTISITNDSPTTWCSWLGVFHKFYIIVFSKKKQVNTKDPKAVNNSCILIQNHLQSWVLHYDTSWHSKQEREELNNFKSAIPLLQGEEGVTSRKFMFLKVISLAVSSWPSPRKHRRIQEGILLIVISGKVAAVKAKQ